MMELLGWIAQFLAIDMTARIPATAACVRAIRYLMLSSHLALAHDS